MQQPPPSSGQQHPQLQQQPQQQIQPYPYQHPMNPAPAKQPNKRDNGDAVFWLLIFWPVGLDMMWKYATWPDVVKSIITLALVASNPHLTIGMQCSRRSMPFASNRNGSTTIR